jgi:hypothetical protein
MALDVILYDSAGKIIREFTGGEDVDYVSYVAPTTYGPPALVAPNKGTPPAARVEDRVLYINTGLVPFWLIERTSD